MCAHLANQKRIAISDAGGNTNINSVDSVLTQLIASHTAARGLPHVVTEWGGSYVHGNTVMGGGGSANPDAVGNISTGTSHDDYDAASFILAAVDRARGLADVFSYWAVSDVFEETAFPPANSSFYGNFGIINTYGVPKPVRSPSFLWFRLLLPAEFPFQAFRAFELLHETGPTRANTTVVDKAATTFGGKAPPPGSCANTTGAIASVTAGGTLSVIVYSQATRGAPIHSACRASVAVRGVDAAVCERLAKKDGATVRRLDADHANPRRRWIELGMPQYPTADENKEILGASEMVPEPLKVVASTRGGGACAFELDVPAQGVAAATLPLL